MQDPGKSRSEKRRIDEGHISVLDVVPEVSEAGIQFLQICFHMLAEQVYTGNLNLQKQFIIII